MTAAPLQSEDDLKAYVQTFLARHEAEIKQGMQRSAGMKKILEALTKVGQQGVALIGADQRDALSSLFSDYRFDALQVFPKAAFEALEAVLLPKFPRVNLVQRITEFWCTHASLILQAQKDVLMPLPHNPWDDHSPQSPADVQNHFRVLEQLIHIMHYLSGEVGKMETPFEVSQEKLKELLKDTRRVEFLEHLPEYLTQVAEDLRHRGISVKAGHLQQAAQQFENAVLPVLEQVKSESRGRG